MSDAPPKPANPKRPLVRSFIEDPLIRIIGLLLLVAASVLLYFNPEYRITPRWRGGPIPSDWAPRTVADRLTLPLPPDLQEQRVSDNEWKYLNDAFSLNVYVDAAAFPIRRDAATMDDFRATSLRVAGQPARMATWTVDDTAQPYHLGVSFLEMPLTLIFTTSSEDKLTAAKSAIHSTQWVAEPISAGK